MRLYVPENPQYGSTSTLFSTAVISGSSSTPNLQDTICDVPGFPIIRPLETLHNALSLKHLSDFLDKMITSSAYRFPSSPSKATSPSFSTTSITNLNQDKNEYFDFKDTLQKT